MGLGLRWPMCLIAVLTCQAPKAGNAEGGTEFFRKRLDDNMDMGLILTKLEHIVKNKKKLASSGVGVDLPGLDLPSLEAETTAPATTDADDCASEPCKNAGDCTDTGHLRYRCRCKGDWTGDNCAAAKVLDDCLPAPCKSHGKCTDIGETYECKCEKGWEGQHCENETDDCLPAPCKPHGKCTDTGQTYQCKCSDGWQGQNCTTDTDDCLTSPCEHGAKCKDTGAHQYRCACGQGWEGVNCARDIDDCLTSPCEHGGGCEDTGAHQYRCACGQGWEGFNCAREVDHCARSPCLNGGKCKNTPDSFQCECTAYWRGRRCRLEVEIDDCEPSPCKNGGVCEDIGPAFQCTCANGWQGRRCRFDANDCEPSPCQHGGLCSDLGHRLYMCRCTGRWDGENCAEHKVVDHCAGSPCHNSGRCTNNGETFACICAEGWEGKTCDARKVVDHCAGSPCHNSGRCSNAGDTFACVCTADWEGRTCDDHKSPIGGHCLSSPCLHGGTCEDRGATFHCECAKGWQGRHCRKVHPELPMRSHCTPEHCTHGQCHNKDNGFVCECVAGWQGKMCHQKAPSLVTNECESAADCSRHGLCTHGVCVCKEGFSGGKCENGIEVSAREVRQANPSEEKEELATEEEAAQPIADPNAETEPTSSSSMMTVMGAAVLLIGVALYMYRRRNSEVAVVDATDGFEDAEDPTQPDTPGEWKNSRSEDVDSWSDDADWDAKPSAATTNNTATDEIQISLAGKVQNHDEPSSDDSLTQSPTHHQAPQTPTDHHRRSPTSSKGADTSPVNTEPTLSSGVAAATKPTAATTTAHATPDEIAEAAAQLTATSKPVPTKPAKKKTVNDEPDEEDYFSAMGMMMERDAIKTPMYVTKGPGAAAPKPKPKPSPSSLFTAEADSAGDDGWSDGGGWENDSDSDL